MWKIIVQFERCDYAYMQDVKNRLCKAGFDNLIIKELVDNDTCSIKLKATNNVIQIQNFLNVVLAETIVKIYKTRMFNNLINITYPNMLSKAMVNLLIQFEMDNDYAFVFNRLDVTKDIIVKSFFNFRCQIMKNKWIELINLTNSNMQFLYNIDVAVEFLSFLINNVSCNSKVNIKYANDCYQITSSKNSEVVVIDKEDNLISNLLMLTPKQINIYCVDNISDYTIKLMYRLFNKRINLLV